MNSTSAHPINPSLQSALAGQGFSIAVIGAKGGAGKSVIAASMAFACAQEWRQRVCLVDLDHKSLGDQYSITGLKPPKHLRDLVNVSSLNSSLIQSALAHHRLGVSLLGLPTDLSPSEQIDPEGSLRVFKQLSTMYPLTVIDLGSDLTPVGIKVLEWCTMLVVVTSSDMLALNQSKRLLSQFHSLLIPREMLWAIVNQVPRDQLMAHDYWSKQLGINVLGLIAKDETNCQQALSKATPVTGLTRQGDFALGIFECLKKLKNQQILGKLQQLNKRSLETGSLQMPKAGNALAAGSGSFHSGTSQGQQQQWSDLKSRIHRMLVEEVDFKKQVSDSDPASKVILREKTKKVVADLLGREENRSFLKTRDQMNQMMKEILDEALGLGPLEDLLADKTISEIMVVGPKKIYYEQAGKNKLSNVTFSSDRQVLTVIERIVAPIGRRIDEKTPYVDARLHDGSRVHAVIPPCAIDGCILTIRKFPEQRLTYKDLVQYGSMTQEMADFLRIAIEGKRNVIVSGGTGSGKTTLINILSGFIPANERIITVEDSAELDLPQEHVVRLETRPPSLDGANEIDIRTLVKQTLRMKPDRIVVGECRGGEALDMLQAMNTGHDGSLTTVHSNSPRDSIGRLETLVQYAGAGLSPRAIREMIASAVHLIVQQTRLEDGSRKIVNITEVSGIQGEVITLQDIFVYRQEGINKQGKIVGKFQSTGFIPKFVEVLERKGYKIPRSIFNNQQGQGAA